MFGRRAGDETPEKRTFFSKVGKGASITRCAATRIGGTESNAKQKHFTYKSSAGGSDHRANGNQIRQARTSKGYLRTLETDAKRPSHPASAFSHGGRSNRGHNPRFAD